MKCLNRCLALFLCIIMVLSMPNTVFAANSTTNSEDVQIYSVPIISNEYDGSHVTFYGIDGKYYLSFDDIKELARFELEETDTTITLTQGLRELVIEKSSGHLVDCDFVDQGNIDIIQYDGKYLCEGIPMLMYLGAACALKENQVLEVMMPTITIWESIMPNYLDYYFNITELYGGEDNVKISLACDIIADVLDGVSGHGLFANGDTHLEDALYEILDVDMMKYESVQESITAQNQSVNEFLASEGLSTFLDGSSSGIDSVSELLDYYADFYLDGEILKNEIRWQRSYSAGDLDTASSLSKEINQQVYEQSAIKANLANADNIGDALDLGMIALDTAITSYDLMQYDDDTKNLFSRTINEEIFRYAGYDDISWNNITDKISKNLSSNESIVQSSALNSIVDYMSEEITEKGVQKILSTLTSKANIYVTATQLATFLASLINYNTNQAFSADMNAIWLSTVQYDIVQLTSRMLVKERDEYHFSDAESLKKLKDMFTLYYRTIIAFSENMGVSVDEFGGKNKSEWIQYFSGTSGKSVSNYAALYLYRITNCTIVPISNYSKLEDNLITSEWIDAFQDVQSINDEIEITNYYDDLEALIDLKGLQPQDDTTYMSEDMRLFFVDESMKEFLISNTDPLVSAYGVKIGDNREEVLKIIDQYGLFIPTSYKDDHMDIYLWDSVGDFNVVSLSLTFDSSGCVKSWAVCNWPEGEIASYYINVLDTAYKLNVNKLNNWQIEYMNFIVDDYYNYYSTINSNIYQLLYINDDNIPELYVDYGTTAAGSKIAYFNGNKVITQSLYVSGLTYLEKENLFRDSGGHMDEYYDIIYSIQDDNFNVIASGHYGAPDNSNVQLDSSGNPIYVYYWNDEQTTKEGYQEMLEKSFDTSREISPFGDYNSATHLYDGFYDMNDIAAEIIKAGKSD